jgi:hypothetical protein
MAEHGMEDTKQVFLLLGRMDGKIDAILVKQGEHTERQDKIEARVAVLEAALQRQSGALTSLLTTGKMVWALVGAAGVYVYKLYIDKG